MNKSLTLASIKHATLLLIEANEKTTTLEVKGVLRDLGYEANQMDVSDLMSQAADELPLEFDNNGQFRTYRLPTPASVIAAATPVNPSSPVVSSAPANNIVSYTKRNGTVLVGTRSSLAAKTNDWKVETASNGALYFDGGLTRDEVRQAYAGINGVDFHNTRSSRV